MAGTPNSQTGLIPQYAASYQVVDVTWTPSAVAAITTAAQTVTVPGVKAAVTAALSSTGRAIPADAVVAVIPPSHVAGVSATVGWVSADDTVSVIFVNPTAGSVTPPSGTWRFVLIGQDNARLSFDG
jgi:hypothetical protein